MTGKELLRRLRRYSRKTGIPFAEYPARGKGDHRMIALGDRRSLLPGPGEIKTGTLHGILDRLGISLDDLS